VQPNKDSKDAEKTNHCKDAQKSIRRTKGSPLVTEVFSLAVLGETVSYINRGGVCAESSRIRKSTSKTGREGRETVSDSYSAGGGDR